MISTIHVNRLIDDRKAQVTHLKSFLERQMSEKVAYKPRRMKIIKGSLSSSWMNSPIPSLLLPLWQNESLCETIGMKICHLYVHSQEN